MYHISLDELTDLSMIYCCCLRYLDKTTNPKDMSLQEMGMFHVTFGLHVK